MNIYNYTSIRTREQKLYNIGGHDIAGGFSVDVLKVAGPVFIVLMFVFFIFSRIIGISMFNFFSDKFSVVYLVISLIISIGVGCALWYIPISGYKLYLYLLAYFTPKQIYMTNFKHTRVRLKNIKYKAFIKNIL